VKICLICPTHPHRFAFCPSAPLRQPVLRTSSWLAPSLPTVRPCDRPVKKTRDAFNRRLPPKRLACTRTSRVPDSRSPVSQRGGPTESWAPYGCFRIGGPDVSRRPRPLRRIVIADRTTRPEPHGLEIGSVGVFFPRTARDRASDIPCRVPRFTVTPLRASPELLASPRVSLLERLTRVGRCADRRDRPPRRLVKDDASDDLGCLRSAGTLPRIRWPLQPRSHDRLTAFRAMVRPLSGTLAPPWVFVRCSPFHSGEIGTPTYLSLPAPNDGFTRRPSQKARPAFTRPCRSFWSAFVELIRGQTPPDDFCNLRFIDVRATKPGLSLPSQGRWPRPPSFSDAPRPLLAER